MNNIHTRGLATSASMNNLSLTSRFSYMVLSRSESRDEIVSIIHRALVEVMTLKEANLPLEICRDAKYTTNEYIQRIAKGAKFHITDDNQISLLLEDEGLQEAVLKCIQPEEASPEETLLQGKDSFENGRLEQRSGNENLPTLHAEERTRTATERIEMDAISPDEAEAMDNEASPEKENLSQTIDNSALHAPVDDSWRRVALTDPDFKFTVPRFLPLCHSSY